MIASRQITGDYLKQRRQSLGLSRKEVAEECGLSASVVNTLEARVHPTSSTAEQVMAAMDRLEARFEIAPVYGQQIDIEKLSAEVKRQVQYLYLFCGLSNFQIQDAMGIKYESVRHITKYLERFQ